MSFLIKNGTITDPENNKTYHADMLIENDKIAKISTHISAEENIRIINADGLYIMPGLIDMNTHLRDPGDSESEDLESGSVAAVAGGFTSICAMPDTIPSVDCLDNINYIKNKASALSLVNVIPISAMTSSRKGEKMVDFDELSKNGIKLFSEGNKSVQSAKLMNEIFKKAASLNITICDHCEDAELSFNGVINESEIADKLELKPISDISELSMMARNIAMANFYKVNYHVCNCSTASAIQLLSMYKTIMNGKLTAEVSPYHIFLSDEDIKEDNANYKTNHPIRSKENKDALIKGLKDGVIDVIATNHSPHAFSYKQLGFRKAPFGIIGLQTAFSICIMSLIDTGILTMPELLMKLSYNPARIIGIERGKIKEGEIADISIADINERYIFNAEMIKSKSKNSPFINRELKGKIKYTIVNGKIVYEDMRKTLP